MSTETETLISENTKKLTLNKTHQKPWHKITGLMFKSKKERVVVGRIDLKTKEYIPFDEEALRLANLWKYTIDPELVESSASEYESEEEEDNGSEMIRDLVKSNHDVEPVKKSEQPNDVSTESDSDDDDGETDSGDESENEENEENEEVATKDESSEPSGDDEDKKGRSVVIVEKREELVKEAKDKMEEGKKEMKKHFESPIGKLREDVEETILMVLQEKLNKLFDVIEEKTKENEKLSSEIAEVKKEKSDVEEKLQKTQKDYEKLNTKWKNLKEMFS